MRISPLFLLYSLFLSMPLSSSAFVNHVSTSASLIPRLYSHCLLHYPMATESITAGVMAGVGDIMAQGKGKQFDRQRTWHFFLKGIGEGVMWSYWYRFAEHWSVLITSSVISSIPEARGMAQVVKTIISIVLDLTIACPIIYGLWDIPFPALLSGTPPSKIPARIRKKLGEMLAASFKVWTPVNIVIYNTPLKYRVILMSIADIFWQSIVSTIASRDVDASPYPA